MGVDQAGKHSGVRKIDGVRACRDLRAGSVGNAFDPVAANYDDLIAAWLVRFAVDEHAGADNRDCGWRLGLGKRWHATRVNTIVKLIR